MRLRIASIGRLVPARLLALPDCPHIRRDIGMVHWTGSICPSRLGLVELLPPC